MSRIKFKCTTQPCSGGCEVETFDHPSGSIPLLCPFLGVEAEFEKVDD